MNDVIKLEETNICVVGLGPAGIGFIWNYFKNGKLNDLLCVESGPQVEQRICPVLNHEYCNLKDTCHVIGGFGGSSLLAGGKLSMYPAGTGLNDIIKDESYLIAKIEEAKSVYLNNITLKYLSIEESQINKAKIYYKQLGFHYKYYEAGLYTQSEFFDAHFNLQSEFLKAGANLWFNTTVISIDAESDKYVVTLRKGNTNYQVVCKKVVVGTGKLGNKFLLKLKKKLCLPSRINKVEIGVRIEFPKGAFVDIDKHHYDLKLKINKCKTFCVSKGGKIVLYYKDGLLYTEGYDNYSKPTQFTNLGFLYKVADDDDINIASLVENIEEQRIQNKMINPIRQTFKDFLENTISNNFPFESSIVNWKAGNISDYLPEAISAELKSSLTQFVESFITKKFVRDISVFFPEINYGGYNYTLSKSCQSIRNFYIIGESTGKFIGILQSFASGLICSEKTLQNEQ